MLYGKQYNMKTCVACLSSKSLDSYYNDSRVKSGKQARCKECVKKVYALTRHLPGGDRFKDQCVCGGFKLEASTQCQKCFYKPLDTPNWRLDKNGYRFTTICGKHVLEHRWVMEQHLKRPLKTQEHIHHINGNRADNRIVNLEIWSTSQPSGQRIQDKINYSVEMLKLYAPHLLK